MRFDWDQPPGAPAPHSIPRSLRTVLTALLVGVISVGVAWAGAGLVPVNDLSLDEAGSTVAGSAQKGWLATTQEDGDGAEAAASGGLEPLQTNQVYAGAYKVNIAPRPADYNGEWNTTDCDATFAAGPAALGSEPGASDPTDFRVRWFENSNCLYAGGFDLGPANAIAKFDEEYGLWARATAVSDGEDTVVLMILDGAYYFAEYGQMCNDDPTHASKYDGEGPGANQYTQDCGFRDLQASLAAKYGHTEDARGQFGIEPSSFFLASSHAHASPDFVGAWGGVPRWYMQQVEDAIREAVYGAIDNMQPAFLEAGEILYRGGNNERRNHYRSAEEATEAWMRFVAEEDAEPVCTEPEPTPEPDPTPTEHVPPGQAKKSPSPTPEPSPSPTCTQPPPDRRAIATIGTYAAHPTDSVGDENRAYADLAGVFAEKAEKRFGGVGLYFQTGFGNMSSAISRRTLGEKLVEFMPELGEGRQVTGKLDVKTVMRTFDQPATNIALSSGGASGVFDRPFEPRPSAVSIGKGSLSADASRMPYTRCNSASGLTVNSQVSAAKIGSLLITGGPGELFSNLTNTIKEQYAGGVAFPLSLVNDGLGYIMQSIETDHIGRQAVGFVNGPLSEYEDAYSIDACFGDHVLEQTLAAMQQL